MKMQGCLDINLSLTIDIESLAEELNGYIGHDEESQKAELPDDTFISEYIINDLFYQDPSYILYGELDKESIKKLCNLVKEEIKKRGD